MTVTIAFQFNLKVEQTPSGKASVGPLRVHICLRDAPPLMSPLDYRPQSASQPSADIREDLAAISIPEIVEPSPQYRRQFYADPFHRSGSSSPRLLAKLHSQRFDALDAWPALAAVVVPPHEVETLLKVHDARLFRRQVQPVRLQYVSRHLECGFCLRLREYKESCVSRFSGLVFE